MIARGRNRNGLAGAVVAVGMLASCQLPDYQNAWRAEVLAETDVDGLTRGEAVVRLGWPMFVTADDRAFLYVAQSVVGMPLHRGETYALRVVVFDPATGRAVRSHLRWANAFDRGEAIRWLQEIAGT